MSTRSEIRNEVRRLLAESSISASYFSDADINAAINGGIQDICKKGRVYERAGTLSIVGTTATYDLALDFLEIKALYDENGKLLDKIEPDIVNRLFTAGAGNVLYFFVFNKGSATGSIKSAILTDGGAGYSVSDVLTVVQSGASGGTLTVLTLNVTAVATFSLTTGGVLYSLAAGLATTVDPPGGTNCTVEITSLTTVVNHQITLYPAPDAGAGVTYNYKYFAQDADLTADGSSPAIPARYHSALAYYAAYECALKGKDLQQAETFQTLYATVARMQIPRGVLRRVTEQQQTQIQ